MGQFVCYVGEQSNANVGGKNSYRLLMYYAVSSHILENVPRLCKEK